jgi:integration host factor subunit alpha
MTTPKRDEFGEMIKADLAQVVYEAHGGISYREALEMVDTILEKIKGSLCRYENVKLTGFGTFCVVERRARNGRNPQTGERILLPESRYVSFRPSRLIDLQLDG